MGTKNGEILIYDIASSTLLETISAHSGTVWSLHVRSDEKALASGSADKTVKFWEFEQKDPSEDSVRAFTGNFGSGLILQAGPKWKNHVTRTYQNVEDDGRSAVRPI